MEDVGGAVGSDEMDMDEYEMMNVRGGSPPPGGASNAAGGASAVLGRYSNDWPDMAETVGGYDSPPDNYSSYESYSDEEQGGNLGVSLVGGVPQRRRKRRDRDETRGGRKRRDRDRERDRDMDRRADGGCGGGGGGGGVGGGGGNKRNRRDSGDDKPRDPRKLELCKFYLKDCCAKRDKCSYMHKEFPCKYFYLGMECHAGDECLFHHGKPLSEQLRNILLKHMETAPKEILGDFKRISRDVALSQMTRRHEQLCEQYNMDNNWTTLASAGISRLQDQQHQQQVKSAQMQAAQQQAQANQAAITAVNANLQQVVAVASATAGGGSGSPNSIPSLLDMVINPPKNLLHGDSKPEKKRKSRWAEKSACKSSAAPAAATAVTPSAAAAAATKTLPAHLDLVNLTQVLSAEHMAKLNKLGISNLEQMMEVPFGQLTEAGLTLPEIGEIQRMAEQAKSQQAGGAAVAAAAESSNK